MPANSQIRINEFGGEKGTSKATLKIRKKDHNEYRHKHHIKSLRDRSPEQDNYKEEYSRKIINRDRDKILVK